MRRASLNLQDTKHITTISSLRIHALPLSLWVNHDFTPMLRYGPCALIRSSMRRRSGRCSNNDWWFIAFSAVIFVALVGSGSRSRAWKGCAGLKVWLRLEGPDINHRSVIIVNTREYDMDFQQRKGLLRRPLTDRFEGLPFALNRLRVWMVHLVCVIEGAVAVP